jgi:D-arabinose 1-dehydrogenase-like Zn-dependent alcohol dehydrogenase
MKAAVVHDFRQSLCIEDVPTPEHGAGKVVVKIETSSTSGRDQGA